MEINLLREAMTVVSFAAFVGVIVWAVHPRNKQGFEEAARLPFDEDATRSPPHPSPRGERANVVEVLANRERR